MICKDCVHYPVCKAISNDTTACNHFKDKSRIVELPMKATEELRKELTEYCYKRCVDEL